MVMSPSALEEIATAVFGRSWQARLAPEIGVTPETLCRIANKRMPLSPRLEAAITLALLGQIKERRKAFDRFEALLS